MHRRTILTALAAAAATPAFGQFLSDGRIPQSWRREFPLNDFSNPIVPLDEIFSGGPPRDGIPALMGAGFHPVPEETMLDPREPVVTLELAGEVPRAYPIRYLTWHEIVNDRIGGLPVAVTFCPLCNSALVFDGRLGGRELTFGVSGRLRFSDMIMYDHQTETWWQQFEGRAIIGPLVGQVLTVLPSWMESWAEFAARNPAGEVMSRPGTALRPYGMNPYAGYDSAARPFLYRGEDPPFGIPPLARVLRVGNRAWPLTRLAAAEVLEEGGLRIEWTAGQASALDTEEIAKGRDIGTIRVFDAATGTPVVHEVVFAFAFHAFHPDGQWMRGI